MSAEKGRDEGFFRFGPPAVAIARKAWFRSSLRSPGKKGEDDLRYSTALPVYSFAQAQPVPIMIMPKRYEDRGETAFWLLKEEIRKGYQRDFVEASQAF